MPLWIVILVFGLSIVLGIVIGVGWYIYTEGKKYASHNKMYSFFEKSNPLEDKYEKMSKEYQHHDGLIDKVREIEKLERLEHILNPD